MFEFRWDIAGQTAPCEARLCIHSGSSWIGRKTFTVRGRLVYRRGLFEGNDQQLPHPEDSQRALVLRAACDSDGHRWSPELRLDGHVIPELTGAESPPVAERPPSIAIVTGLAYLTILMLLVMLPHIWKMLDAGFGASDSRFVVVKVVDDDFAESITVHPTKWPPARAGVPYEIGLRAEGGIPPYTWRRVKGRLPAGLSFDAANARISGTAADAQESVFRLGVSDAEGATIERPFVVSVQSDEERIPGIDDVSAPPARLNEPFSLQLRARGGLEPYRWKVNSRKLPNGLAFDKANGRIHGTPVNKPPRTEDDVEERIAKYYPVRVRVTDASYDPWTHVGPWCAPFAVTIVCLVGFWNMRRWSVFVYAACIAAQCAAGLLFEGIPIGFAAVGSQLAILGVGVVNLAKMR